MRRRRNVNIKIKKSFQIESETRRRNARWGGVMKMYLSLELFCENLHKMPRLRSTTSQAHIIMMPYLEPYRQAKKDLPSELCLRNLFHPPSSAFANNRAHDARRQNVIVSQYVLIKS